jgi:Protein of unknown function (DUF3616)
LPNVSAVAAAGSYLWTSSDEMRTVECLEPAREGYRLRRQFMLDELFPGLPGAEEAVEADVEALDVAHGRLWVCGSHSMARRSRSKNDPDRVDPRIRKRPSRALLGSIELSEDGGAVNSPGVALPYKGVSSLRARLGADPHIAPFMDLPSKENGLDIEGMAIFGRKIYLGMRGPVVDNIALVAANNFGPRFAIGDGHFLHFIDLGGLGVRDLTRWANGILILAGPVNGANGPFKLLHWTPRRTLRIQKAEPVLDLSAGIDHPEGICALQRGRVMYDTKGDKRISGTRCRADWIRLPRSRELQGASLWLNLEWSEPVPAWTERQLQQVSLAERSASSPCFVAQAWVGNEPSRADRRGQRDLSEAC